MPRLSVVNLLIGFMVIVLASCGGFFVAYEAEKSFIFNGQVMQAWPFVLMKSAHGHLNLYGFLHIAMGLSLPYSQIGRRGELWQTVGLALGTFAMGFLLLLRAWQGVPSSQWNLLGIVIASALMSSILALIAHCYGLALKLFR